MHFPKLLPIAVLLPSLLFPTSVLAEEEELSARERFNLCSAFPLNSRCEGYTAPVSLKQRPGEEMVCLLNSGTTQTAGQCKIEITEEEITVYQEYGEKIDLIDNRRDTEEMTIEMSNISSIQYRETSKVDVLEVVFISLWALFSPDKFAEVSILFSDEAQANSSKLTFVTDRDVGLNLRGNLERTTGIFAEILPEDEEEEETESEEAPTLVNPTPEPTDLEAFCESFPENSRCTSPSR